MGGGVEYDFLSSKEAKFRVFNILGSLPCPRSSSSFGDTCSAEHNSEALWCLL